VRLRKRRGAGKNSFKDWTGMKKEEERKKIRGCTGGKGTPSARGPSQDLMLDL
jgi:hypothetical protein